LEFNQSVQLVDRIITGRSIVEYKNKIFIVKDPTPYERQQGDLCYNSFFEQIVEDGVPTYKELEKIYEEQGYLNKVHKKFTDTYKKELLGLNKELKTYQFRSNEANKIKDKIRFLQKQNDKLKDIYSEISLRSAEYVANVHKHKFFVYALTQNEDGSRFWKNSFEEFLLENDKLPSYILGHAFYPKNINEKEIRYIARNEPWRSSWITACKVGGLMPHPIAFCTDLQKALFTWSHIYDNALESHEPPSSDVIENDDLFDAWMAEKTEERKKERFKQSQNSKIPTTVGGKQGDKTDVYIVVDTPEDAKRVFEMNDPTQKRFIAQDEKAIANGLTDDIKSPQNQFLMKMKANQR
jgi:hypothetical protein